MAATMRKRLVRKLDLEILLSRIPPHPSPKIMLEQYTISEDAAATMLHIAAYMYKDIAGKTVLDAGCGTGRLALGAAFLGAKSVVGVDIDKEAVKLAFKSSLELNLRRKLQLIIADINVVRGKFDTVIQNPPFGVQKRKADRKFLEKALEIGKRIYTLHNRPIKDKHLPKKLKKSPHGFLSVRPSPFIQEFVENKGGKILAAYALPLTIPRMFPFHTRRRYSVIAELYVVESFRNQKVYCDPS